MQRFGRLGLTVLAILLGVLSGRYVVHALQDIQITKPGGGGGTAGDITAGTTTITGCGANQVLYQSTAGGLVDCEAAFTYVEGSNLLTVDSIASGASALTLNTATTLYTAADGTNGFLNVTGTMPLTPTGTPAGAKVIFTGAGTDSDGEDGLRVTLNAGYTGAGATHGSITANLSAGTGTTFTSTGAGNFGHRSTVNSSTTGTNIGMYSLALNSGTGRSIGGMVGDASASGAGIKVGLHGFAGTYAVGATSTTGLVGSLTSATSNIETFTYASAAGLFDNGNVAAPIILFRDNGTVFAGVGDGGTAFFGTTGLAGANGIEIGPNTITSEGSSADANELVLAFGNHTADVTETLTATANTLTWASASSLSRIFQTTDASSSALVESQSTSTTGLGAIRARNDRTSAAANILLLQYGSAHGGTLAGVSTNDLGAVVASGTSLSGMIVGVTTADPFYLITNDTKRLQIGSAGALSLEGTVTAAGTTGARTINKMSGTVNFAAAATTLVVTNSLATTSSAIMAMARTNDATCSVKDVEPAAGSFTIRMTAACTAETSVAWNIFEPNL